jgi:hypothetical protein
MFFENALHSLWPRRCWQIAAHWETAVPPAGANPVAWDGLGPGPTEDAQPLELRPEQHARAKHEIILGPLNAAPAEPNRKVQS